MRRFRIRMGMPLFKKELAELAARRRTYAVRVAYALLLYLAFGIHFEWLLAEQGHAYYGSAMLGVGSELIFFMTRLQVIGILLFLPAMVSGVLTTEKERQSLSLLLITDLRPWEILLEKLAGRLIPMVTFLLLGAPLFAVAYAFGGVSPTELWGTVVQLLLLCLQVGALSLLCSAYCASTAFAFLCSYFGVALLAWLPISSLRHLWDGSYLTLDGYRAGSIGVATANGHHVGDALATVLSTVLFLQLARAVLLPRAFARPRNRLLESFQFLDRFLHGVNQVFGNVYLRKPVRWLPRESPVHWRDVSTKSLGKIHYQVRMIVLVLIPVVLAGSWLLAVADLDRGRWYWPAFAGQCFLWTISCVTLAVIGTGAFGSERARGTLDVLLTTPIASRDIVEQKAALPLRYAFILSVPIVFWTLVEAILASYNSVKLTDVICYFLCSLSLLFVYLPLLSWISVALGLLVRSRSRAIGWTLLFLLAINMPAPLGAAFITEWSDSGSHGISALFFLLSPASLFLRNEAALMAGDSLSVLPVMLLNVVLYFGVLRWFRKLCLDAADVGLGRGRLTAEKRFWKTRRKRMVRIFGRRFRRAGSRRGALAPTSASSDRAG